MKRALLLLSTAILVTACGSTPPAASPGGSGSPGSTGGQPATPPASAPAWVNNAGRHPAYPDSAWMTAVGAAVSGEAETKDRAIQDGRKKIAEELNSQVQAVTDSYLREVAAGDEYSSSYDYAQRVRNQTEGLLFGSRAVEEYQYGGTTYVLVVLNRENQAEAVFNNVDAELAKVESNRQASAAGELRALLDEHVVLEEVMPSLVTIGIVLRKGHPMRGEFESRWSEVTRRIEDVLRRYRDQDVTLRCVAGNGQRGYPNTPLDDKLTFEATAGGRPLVGFPVRFDLEYPERAELVDATPQTGPDGRFSCQVTGIKLTGDEENEVRVALDFAKLGEESLSPPGATAIFVLPTLQSATFSVAIVETNVGKELPESAVRAALEAGLTARRAKTIEIGAHLSAADVKKASTESPAWIRERLAGKVDYLIRGTARSKFSSKKTVVFCHAGGDFEMIDVRTGEQVATYSVPLSSSGIKAPGQHEEDAGTRALEKLGEDVGTRFMAKVDEVFEQ